MYCLLLCIVVHSTLSIILSLSIDLSCTLDNIFELCGSVVIHLAHRKAWGRQSECLHKFRFSCSPNVWISALYLHCAQHFNITFTRT
jgi:hypothetical protein